MWNRSKNRRSLRRSLEVEQDFKQRQLMWVLGFAVVYVVLSSLVLGAFYVQLLHAAVVGAPPLSFGLEDSLEMWNQLPGLRYAVTLWATALTGLSVFFATAVGLIWTHKTGGPIYRFKTALARLRDGQAVEKITLRRGDEFQDLAVALNETLESVEARERDLRLRLHASETPEGLDQLCAAQRAIRERVTSFDPKGLCQADAERVELLLEELKALVAKGE